jgi:hypothetical protein
MFVVVVAWIEERVTLLRLVVVVVEVAAEQIKLSVSGLKGLHADIGSLKRFRSSRVRPS